MMRLKTQYVHDQLKYAQRVRLKVRWRKQYCAAALTDFLRQFRERCCIRYIEDRIGFRGVTVAAGYYWPGPRACQIDDLQILLVGSQSVPFESMNEGFESAKEFLNCIHMQLVT